jgi:hypothetical protein
MEELSTEALRRAEQVAGDYRSTPEREDHSPAHGPGRALLGRAVEVLRTRTEEATPDEAFGLNACARLLEEVSRCRLRGEEIAPGVLTAANEIAEQVLHEHFGRPPGA